MSYISDNLEKWRVSKKYKVTRNKDGRPRKLPGLKIERVQIGVFKGNPTTYRAIGKRLYMVDEAGRIVMETVGKTQFKKPYPKKKGSRDFRFKGYYKLGTNSIVFMEKKQEGGLMMRVNGGLHAVDFNLDEPSERRKAFMVIARAMGYSPRKRKRGGFDIYVSTTK